MRGEIWTVRASGYATKPRPAVIVQSDEVEGFDSTIVCLFTTDDSISDSISAPTRVKATPTEENGLSQTCWIMAEKPIAIKKSTLGIRTGTLDSETLSELDAALRIVLELD